MKETQRSSAEVFDNKTFLQDSYFVWDSISVWITNKYWENFDWKVLWWKQTWWMLEQVKKDVENLKNKKVMFLLWWTNDIFSNKSASHIKSNIDQIVKIAIQNWLKVVVWTIPPFSAYTKTVQNMIQKLKTTPEKLNSIISEVNEYIRTKYNFIDYHSMIEDKSNPNNIDPKYEWKNNWDGIHPYNAYKIMWEAQKIKFSEIMEDSLEKKFWDKNLNDLNKTIISLKTSLDTFKNNISGVLLGEITQEQKTKMNEIILAKQDLIKDFENIYQELSKSKYELLIKKQEFNSYEAQNLDEDVSKEYIEIQDKMFDLEKRIFELDEQQSILLKEFRVLSGWEKVNGKLEKKEIDSMLTITTTEFLKKPFPERLKYVTIWNIDSKDVVYWNVKDLEINFSFNGKFNRQLYLNTTAWMILPDEVREVEVNGEKFFRNPRALKWEFFNENWKRLIIRDETKITISKLEPKEELEKKFISKIDLTKYENDVEKEIAIESEKRWVPVEIAISMFSEELKKLDSLELRNAIMEDLFVEIDRKKWEYFVLKSKKPTESDWKFSLEFISYLLSYDNDLFEKTAKWYGYTEEQIKQLEKTRENNFRYNWSLDLEKFASLDISAEEVKKIRSIRRFEPYSKDAVTLFRIAAKVWDFPESWATNQDLHYILGRESNWKVWILNYTIKWISLSEFKILANSSNVKNPIWAKSTASGLWQLLLSNVDKYYPSWRKWIWDPIEEAIWFINYIKDRYGSPEVARSVYWRIWSYTHAITKVRMKKWFKEWY